MYEVLKIGEKDVPMMAMASIDIYYKRIFNEDPIKLQTSKEFDVGTRIEFCQKMGFVMAKYAELKERKKMLSLKEDDYIDFMEGIEWKDYLNAVDEVWRIYNGEKKTGSEEKKEGDQ